MWEQIFILGLDPYLWVMKGVEKLRNMYFSFLIIGPHQGTQVWLLSKNWNFLIYLGFGEGLFKGVRGGEIHGWVRVCVCVCV